MGISRTAVTKFEPLAVALLAFVFLFAATAPMLPVVMQDELVYRQQVLTQSVGEFEYPNYLFSLAAWIAEQAGEDFYLIIKLFNSAVAGLSAGVLFFVLARLYSRATAFLASAVFVLFPSVFQASFYMPDMFVSAFLLATTALLLFGVQQGRGPRDWIWIVAAIPLTLAFLSKPHTLIAIGGFLLFGMIDSARSRKLSPVFLTVSVAFLARLLTGFLVAGTSGLNIFGKSYSQSLLRTGSQQGSGQLSASGANVLAGQGSTANPNLFASFGWEFFQLLAAIGFITLGLLVSILIFWNRSTTYLFVSVIVLTSIGGIALFETLVGLSGDDHSVRILTRHVEYLTPLVFAVGLHGLGDFRRSSKPIIFGSLGLVTAVLVAGWVVLSNLPSHRISDGTTVVLSGLWGGGFVILVAFVGAMLWIVQISESRWPGVVVSSVFVLSSFFAFWEVRTAYSIDTEVDLFGKSASVSGVFADRDVLVVADAKANAELFRFYLLPLNAEQKAFRPGTIVAMEEAEDPSAIFVPLGSIQLDTNCETRQLGDYVYYDCSNLAR